MGARALAAAAADGGARASTTPTWSLRLTSTLWSRGCRRRSPSAATPPPAPPRGSSPSSATTASATPSPSTWRRRSSRRAPSASSRVSQLGRLLNRRLLESREARRRALRLSTPGGCRLSPSTSLVAADASALSLARAARTQPRRRRSLAVRCRPRAPADGGARRADRAAAPSGVRGGERAGARRLAVEGAPRRRAERRATCGSCAARLRASSLHSLACYSLGLRATQPQAITVARASGASRAGWHL